MQAAALSLGAGRARQPGDTWRTRTAEAATSLVFEAGTSTAVRPSILLGPHYGAGAPHQSLPLLPGAATASEVMNLAERGYKLLKYFPAEQTGGVELLQTSERTEVRPDLTSSHAPFEPFQKAPLEAPDLRCHQQNPMRSSKRPAEGFGTSKTVQSHWVERSNG